MNIFCTYPSQPLLGFYTITDLFLVYFLDQGKIFLIEKEQEDFWYILILQLVKGVIFSSQGVILGSQGKELYSVHYV